MWLMGVRIIPLSVNNPSAEVAVMSPVQCSIYTAMRGKDKIANSAEHLCGHRQHWIYSL